MELEDRRSADFDPGLRKGQILANQEIQQLFQCTDEGSVRQSVATNSLILITGDSLGPYRDRWEGQEFHFTGRGPRGDQDLDEGLNRALAESSTTDVALFHIDNPEGDRYVYTGRVKLAAEPYAEQQPDELGVARRVWMFPLAVIRSQRELEWRRAQLEAEAELEPNSGAWPRFVGWVKETIGVRD